MISFFLKIYDFFHGKKSICYAILAIIVVVLLVMVSSLKYNEDIYDFLPMDEKQQKAITVYQDMTGGQRIVAMFKMKDEEDNDKNRLTDAVDFFTDNLKKNPGAKHIKEITAQVDFDKIADLSDFAYHNMPYMLSDADYERMDSIISSHERIKEQLSQDVQLIMMPASGVLATNISYDPLGLFDPVMKRLQSKQANLPFEMDNGYIYTSDNKYAVVLLTSAYGSMESANNTLLVNYVDSISHLTMDRYEGVDVAITGSPVIAVDNANQIKSDSRLAITISVVLILSLLVVSFRSAKNLLLIGVSILFGWLFAMSFIAVFRSNVSLIVLGIGSIIIGIAVNYPLHFIAHIAHGGNIREVLKDMVSPLLIGNITTVGAFASLIPLKAPALRDLGLFAAFMLVGTILFVLVFLPHMVNTHNSEGKERLLFGRLSTFSFKIRGWMFWMIIALTVVMGYYSLGTSFDANMHHINYLTPTQERLMADLHISAGVNDTSNVYLVSEGETWNEALQEHARMSLFVDSLRNVNEIKSFTDVTSFVCSEADQKKKIEKWNQFWNSHFQETAQLLNQYSSQYGFDEDAFISFNEIVAKKYEPQSFDYFEPLTSTLLSRSFSRSTGKKSVIDVIDVGGSNVVDIEKTINENATKGYSFDFVGMNSSVANALSNDFNYIGFACGFIVFIFLWISFGRFELSLLAFMPMAVGWIWILGIMNICGMQFNIVNVILATFIFGQGDDYTIFMTDGLINEYAYRKKLLPSYKNSIIISALIMFIGMGSLIVAKHPALHSLAEVTIVGMLTVVLMAWVVPQMIFNWLTKTDNHIRYTPVTMEQIIRTTYCTAVYLFELFYGCIIGYVIKFLPWRKEKNTIWFHRIIYRTMQVNINNICGVKFRIHNKHNETFKRGSVLISNHQSILDPIIMLALSPHILVLISEKVWNNPIVHPLFKLAGFINLNQPMDSLKAKISDAVEKGYNVVIFPEGKRNHEQITRFHKGAFYIAREIGADILPVFIHGVGHVMPKGSAFASKGTIDIEIGSRMSSQQLDEYGATDQQIAHRFHLLYMNHLKELKQRIATTDYYRDYIIYKYTYKGGWIEQETRKMLKKCKNFKLWIDGYVPNKKDTNEVAILNGGCGQFPLLFALVHPELDVHSYECDEDNVAIANNCVPLPQNLHIHLCDEKQIKTIRSSYKNQMEVPPC